MQPSRTPVRSKESSKSLSESMAGASISDENSRPTNDSDLRKFNMQGRSMSIASSSALGPEFSAPVVQKSNANIDRFIPYRNAAEDMASQNSSLNDLSDVNNLTSGKRILSFAEAPPPPSSSLPPSDIRFKVASRSNLTSARQPSATSVAEAKKRALSKLTPERILDAPGMSDDFYTSLLAWSIYNLLAVGLAERVYVFNAGTGDVSELCQGNDNEMVCSLEWSGDGAYLAVAWEGGDLQIWDVEAGTKLRTMSGHTARVGALSWSSHILSSGSHTSRIHMHDVRMPEHHVDSLLYHASEITGLKWKPNDGYTLASGGNDNAVVVWDWRVGSGTSTGNNIEGRNKEPKWAKRNHTAAVKALAWSPHQPSLLATGGGTGDHTIHFWQSTTGARVSSLTLESQVTGLHFSQHTRDILSTHGFPKHNMAIHSYPGLELVADWNAHDARVLHSAMSPDGTIIATASADENLKFWKIWQIPHKGGKGKGEEDYTGLAAKGIR